MMTDPKEVLEIPKDNAIFGGSFATFEKFGYSPAVRAGGLFIAGVVGARPDGSVPDSVGEQAELAFQRTAEILRLERLTMADLVEVVSYHVDPLPGRLSGSTLSPDRSLRSKCAVSPHFENDFLELVRFAPVGDCDELAYSPRNKSVRWGRVSPTIGVQCGRPSS